MSDKAIDAIVRIELTDEPLIPGMSGVKDGRPWIIPTKMPAYLWQGDKYPTRIEIPVPEGGRPRPGVYLLAGSPFSVGVKGTRASLVFDERAIRLLPIEALTSSKLSDVKAA